ncbi:MAG TPA: Ig-like domain-containing protein, partial [Lacunisphaera sp.]|nr:Ig-like domain-containing protein [Lacunisphaera sp.]
PNYGGASDGPGAATPTAHRVTLNGNAHLGGLLRRVDPIALPAVSAPPAPAGSRNVTINSPGQGAGDFATVRDLTLNGNAGTVAVPPGTYGRFTANGNSNFRLGVAGDTTPASYNLQGLTLNGNGTLEIVGPVVLTLANGTSFNASLGNVAHPEWLEVRVASGGITLNGNVACYGSIIAPAGTVIVNGSTQLAGHVVADRFTINGNGALANPADQSAPTVAITSPAAGDTVTGTIEVLATAADNTAVAAVQFKLDDAPLGLEDTTAPFGVNWTTVSATAGGHTLTAVARDVEGNFTTSAAVPVTVADQTPPTIRLTAPNAGAPLSGTATVSATAADDVAVTGVQFQLDGADFGPQFPAAPYELSWNTALAAPGPHTLKAIARDAADHVTVSAEMAVTVADQAAPSITLTSPTDGTTVSGVVTLAVDTTDNVGVTGVQYRLNDANFGALVTTAPFTLAWDTVPLTEGTYRLAAIAHDAAGHVMESAPVSVRVANTSFDTFENGAVTGWTTDGGSWNLTAETGTTTWRQSDRTSVAYRAVRDGTNWADQVVEADVKLFSANGSNRFFGVVARHQASPNDYYYLILRTNNTIELKKLVNNVSANLTPAVAFPVATNTSYRLRLEVIGSTLKGYVNGQLKIQGNDSTFATGTGGLLTFFTDVSFDDVHLDPTPGNPLLLADDFEAGAGGWTAESGSWTLAAAGSQVYRQANPSGPARAVAGQPAWADQIVELDLWPRSFGSATGMAGLQFRQVDAKHYYAIALRNGNTLELLRVDGDTVTTLASATTPVTVGTGVGLRLDAVGNSLKVYRDGALVLQAVDDTYAAGTMALATEDAAADFDDVSVVGP